MFPEPRNLSLIPLLPPIGTGRHSSRGIGKRPNWIGSVDTAVLAGKAVTPLCSRRRDGAVNNHWCLGNGICAAPEKRAGAKSIKKNRWRRNSFPTKPQAAAQCGYILDFASRALRGGARNLRNLNRLEYRERPIR